MPQEIEVWYLIPSLRKEISRILVEKYGFSQKEVSKTMKISEGAVSQYLKSKRGNDLEFNKKELSEIKKSAKNIAENPEEANQELYKVCVALRGSKSMCDLHKKYDPSVPKNCDLCSKN